MPKGHYERKARGAYNTRGNVEGLRKRVLYLTDKEFFSIKQLSERTAIPYSNLIRNAIDEFLFKNGLSN